MIIDDDDEVEGGAAKLAFRGEVFGEPTTAAATLLFLCITIVAGGRGEPDDDFSVTK